MLVQSRQVILKLRQCQLDGITDLQVLFLAHVACEIRIDGLKTLQCSQQLQHGGRRPREGSTEQQAAPVDVLGLISEQRFNIWNLQWGERTLSSKLTCDL